ncbi:30S ribosomal protein S20 [Tepidimicrobium xylanilyticum]|uniref:Small ribosomal subunit protein bS20 n=1 Tax=Tepidimicrobium xylanilyticum TaxID=1123352 RepID=A0A1H2T5I8_9FIRM|nr:30S ribosomal protein S20 [Tepidimicrobium xylanilyticum]GMG96021.1 30S ribosomal protein S20 [Tepidimicrobium xylanilyticum]SDW39213.1 SSU ribosomal protein S20P [Tepidimicrobium xylanilyticum]
MANIKSAKKRIKTIKKRTALNRSRKSEIKTYIKKFDLALENGNLDEAKELLKIIDRKLKRASHKRVIHKNAASRRISSLTKKLNNRINEAV